MLVEAVHLHCLSHLREQAVRNGRSHLAGQLGDDQLVGVDRSIPGCRGGGVALWWLGVYIGVVRPEVGLSKLCVELGLSPVLAHHLVEESCETRLRLEEGVRPSVLSGHFLRAERLRKLSFLRSLG